MSVLDKKYFKVYFFFLSIAFILFAALRFEVGPDYNSYVDIFDQLNMGLKTPYLKRIEPGYKIINILMGNLGLTVHTVFFICTSIVFINYYYAFHNMGINPVFGSLFFLIYLFIPNVLNLVRFGVAVSFIHLAFSCCITYGKLKKRTIRKAILFLLLGSLFHYVCVLMIPVVFFVSKKLSKRIIIFLFIISIISMNGNLIKQAIQSIPTKSYILYIIVEYASKDSTTIFGIGTLLKILIFLYYLYLNKSVFKEEVKTFTINCLLFYLVSVFMFKNIPTLSERLAHIFTIGFILASYDIVAINIKNKRNIIMLGFMSICFLFYLQWIKTPPRGKNPSFIPYKTIELIKL